MPSTEDVMKFSSSFPDSLIAVEFESNEGQQYRLFKAGQELSKECDIESLINKLMMEWDRKSVNAARMLESRRRRI